MQRRAAVRSPNAFVITAKRAGSQFVRWGRDHEAFWYAYGAIGKVHARDYDVGRSIVVSGSARSGTTWLMEMIGGITGYVTVNEPEMPSPKPKVERHLGYDLEWRIYKDPELEDPAFTAALHRMLSGSYLRPSCVGRDLGTARALLRGSPLIVKFIRANLYLPYLHARFPKTKIVQIVRDPYAVVASQLTHPSLAWRASKPLTSFGSRAIDAIVDLASPLSLTHLDEILASQWCLEHAWLERTLDRLGGVHFVKYEDLYKQPEKTLRDLVAYLDRPWDERYLDLVDQRSRSVRSESALLANADPTINYKRRLTEEQQMRIGDVLNAFQHPFYKPW